MKICIIGSGGWGCAMAVHLKKIGHSIIMWSYFEEEYLSLKQNNESIKLLPGIKLDGIDFTTDMEYAIKNSELIVIAVPSVSIRSTAKSIAQHIDKQCIVCLTKGLEDNTFLRMSQVIEQEIKNSKIVVLTGPSHAEEVGKGMITTLIASSKDDQLQLMVQEQFMDDKLRIYVNNDIVGAELGGALKNIYALAVGIAVGLGLGDNAKAALMTRGMTELVKLGIKLGAKIETFYGLSGMGDLIVTCTSEHSRNRRAGALLGQGYDCQAALKKVGMTVEGVSATVATYHLKEKMGIEMPIVDAIYSVLFENKSAKQAVIDLMQRERKGEIEQTVDFRG